MLKYKREILKSNKKLDKEANKLLRGVWGSKAKVKPDTTRKKRIRKGSKRIPKKYNLYIKSKHWDKRKNVFWKKHERKCVICGSSGFINLHHIVYGNYGIEKDEHLVALCRYHHQLYHDTYKTKRNMEKETLEFICEQKELLEFPKFS